MLDLKRSPLSKIHGRNRVDPGYSSKSGSSTPNPFDFNGGSDGTKKVEVESTLPKSHNPFDDTSDVDGTHSHSPPRTLALSSKKKYKNDFRDAGGLESQTVGELEDYAVYKAEETTSTVRNCLKIAEEMKEEATITTITLHQQGEQITRTHGVAIDIDRDLSRGEKLLGSLGGIFSKTWKPTKNRSIKGPVADRENEASKRIGRLEQREKSGLAGNDTRRHGSVKSSPGVDGDGSMGSMQRVEVERKKQDDALSEISTLLGDLKLMAVDMGSEIDRQSRAIDNLYDDVDELGDRVKGANMRARRLLRK